MYIVLTLVKDATLFQGLSAAWVLSTLRTTIYHSTKAHSKMYIGMNGTYPYVAGKVKADSLLAMVQIVFDF